MKYVGDDGKDCLAIRVERAEGKSTVWGRILGGEKVIFSGKSVIV